VKRDNPALVGIDVGSSSIKLCAVDPAGNGVLFSRYAPHYSDQRKCVADLIVQAERSLGSNTINLAFTGSGGKHYADLTGAFYIQEVVANSIFVIERFPRTNTSIEIGGQDSKILFFYRDDQTDTVTLSDMRMNNLCAGGTGAFIESMASLLNVPIGDFDSLASHGRRVHTISGRCGVFAKTDIQQLLRNGASREDIALSAFHALAKQLIGGLAQGKTIHAPVLFGGGPFTFNRRLGLVLAEKLGLSVDEYEVPKHGEMMVAEGAALSLSRGFGSGMRTTLSAVHRNLTGSPGLRSRDDGQLQTEKYEAAPFFSSPVEKAEFHERHSALLPRRKRYPEGAEVPVFLGIDGGSTTLKYVLIDEQGELVDWHYGNSYQDPVYSIREALLQTFSRCESAGVTLSIRGCGATGYSGTLLSRALRADLNPVETIAHAHAALQYTPDARMIIDIGGQDMKVIQVSDRVITGITLNEACSSGCGSFIETFAQSMNVPLDAVAERAFNSESPSLLGSRCTVFMNSSIITEQRDGKSLDDILAGISKSIVENMFTKMIRVNNFDAIGDVIVVQGGTFRNDAVLRAMEQYTGKRIVRPPFPEMMGAIGTALLTQEAMTGRSPGSRPLSTFLTRDELQDLAYTKQEGMTCGLCINACNRTLISFNHGGSYFTGNRCEKGGTPADRDTDSQGNAASDLFLVRERLILRDYEPQIVSTRRHGTVGLPLVLEFWDSLPFWKAFFEALRFDVLVSGRSSYELFESGLHNVASEAVCLPAKVAHGHIRMLAEQNVDLIFMPMMIKTLAERRHRTNVNMCAVVQGYPNVVGISDNPAETYGVRYEHPVFHWNTRRIRNRQLCEYFQESFGIGTGEVLAAAREADRAQDRFRSDLLAAGAQVISETEKSGEVGVVIVGRPYHNDMLINHHISSHFTKLGVPALTSDSIPELDAVDTRNLRIDPVNPFHMRMYASALYAASHPNLEIVQLVSFGCGHDGIMTDELARSVREVSGKEILVLKVDESEAEAPLDIRVRSFVETVRSRRNGTRNIRAHRTAALSDPFPTKFFRKDRKRKIIFTPNISKAHCDLISAITRRAGYKSMPMPIADRRAIELGKKYVHNDLCFPAHINIGEILRVLESEKYRPDEVTIGFGKICDDCRSVQYSVLARKALDEAGYPDVTIVTTGKKDEKKVNPGFSLGALFQYSLLWGLATLDAMNDILLKTRPYEVNKGECDRVYRHYSQLLTERAERSLSSSIGVFREFVEAFNQIPVDRTVRRERVLVIGELLMNFKEAANLEVVRYFERNGMEAVLPPAVDFLRRDIVRVREGVKRRYLTNPVLDGLTAELSDLAFSWVWHRLERAKQKFRFNEKKKSIHELAENVAGIIDKTFVAGEGWIIPAEIVEKASDGVKAFVVLQPFGCMPNHISGHGVFKRLKELYPDIRILSLDYDADTSIANVENRLQMLILNNRVSTGAFRAMAVN
jgi:predicted CoA-substrate-specific enzyme activase